MLEETDEFALRVNESRNGELAVVDFHVHWGHGLSATQADRLVQVGLEIVDLNVEGD